MPVHIAEISLDGLHPQPPLHLFPRRVNLIYGRNEFGKTRLVEFLLQSIFHSSKNMTIRPVEATGRVRISGLGDAAETWFTPRSRDRLEDHLVMQDFNLPPQLARLLVVKGAESELQAGNPGGLGRAALNEYITNQGLIDRIAERVPKNTRQAQVQDGMITGSTIGDLKRRKEILDQIAMVDRLFEEIDRHISGGPLAELALHLAELEPQAAVQKNARQHFMNRLASQQTLLQHQSNSLPSGEILHLEADIREEAHLLAEISRLENSHREKQPVLESRQWLEAAIQTYQVTPGAMDTEMQWLFPLLAGGGILGIVAFSFLNYPWLALFFAVIALFFGFLSYRQFRLTARTAVYSPENQRILIEFKRRFGKRCSGLTDLQARKTSLDGETLLLQNLGEQIQTNNRRLQELSSQIEIQLSHWLPEFSPSQTDRQAALKKIKSLRSELDTALMQIEVKLKSSSLPSIPGGDESDADSYNPQKTSDLEMEINSLKERISEIQHHNLSLKQRICDITASPISNDFSQLLLALQEHRSGLEQTCKALTADILAGIAVTQAMQELRSGEDAALQTALQSPSIQNLLKAVTGRYDRIDLHADNLEVSDGFQTFRLDELSTGAQEQVLLGLRIGLASRLFAGQPLFLILDDAFQHSDWQRRPAMVDEVIHLAQNGWQIFYLTMDDHLRDLFLEKTPKELGDDFQSISLAG